MYRTKQSCKHLNTISDKAPRCKDTFISDSLFIRYDLHRKHSERPRSFYSEKSIDISVFCIQNGFEFFSFFLINIAYNK